jgi:hypothetical protein
LQFPMIEPTMDFVVGTETKRRRIKLSIATG